MKAKIATIFILSILILGTFAPIFKVPPAKATVAERITNGGFEDGWTGWTNVYGSSISDSEHHTGSYSLFSYSSRVDGDTLGNIPRARIQTFGFYGKGSSGNYIRIYYQDDTYDTYNIPSSGDWEYHDLLSTVSAGQNVSYISVRGGSGGPIYTDDYSLISDDTPLTLYEVTNIIYRDDFVVEYGSSNFTFSAELYVDSDLNQTVDTEMKLIYVSESWAGRGLDVFLYVNSSGNYIRARGEGGGFYGNPVGEGYHTCSLATWHDIYYEFLWFEGNDTEKWSIQVDGDEIVAGSDLGYSYTFHSVYLGAYGAPDPVSNFSIYYDDVYWTAGSDDFESGFPDGWTVLNSIGLSTVQSVSATHSVHVPQLGEPLVPTISPGTANINRNTTQTFDVDVVGGNSPYTYKWCVNDTEQIGETSASFDFRTEGLGFYEIYCNVTDATDVEAKSNVADCTVSDLSLDVTASPSSVSLDLGDSEAVSASVEGGSPPLQYRWFRNGTAVGTNSSAYTIDATAWGVGVWNLHCNVTDSIGTNESLSWFDGFETGDTSQWDYAAGDPPVVTTQKHSGTYAMFTWANGSVAYQSVQKFTESGLDILLFQEYIYVENLSLPDTDYVTISRIQTSNDYDTSLRIINSGGTYYFRLDYGPQGSESNGTLIASPEVVNGTWYNTIIRLAINNTDLTEKGQVWIDDVLKDTVSWDNEYGSDEIFFVLSGAIQEGASAEDFTFQSYFDDCKYWSTTDQITENKSNTVMVYISSGVLTVNISPSGTVASYIGLKTDFTSSVSGGIPPYTYEWYVDTVLNATTSTFTLIHDILPSHGYSVNLKVYDAALNSEWSSTTLVDTSEPTITINPENKILRIGQTVILTATATPGMGYYTWSWFSWNETLGDWQVIITRPESSSNTDHYDFVPATEGDFYIQGSVQFNTTYIAPFTLMHIEIPYATIVVFGQVRREPALVAVVDYAGPESLPLGHLAQKSAFTVHDYYWQFWYDGEVIGGFAYGSLFCKFSGDTQNWVGSDVPFDNILNQIPFYLPSASPAVYHGWAGGVPFTLCYDNASDTLYVVYTQGSSTASRYLKIVSATYNETAVGWDWGTPQTIVTYSSPRLPVCPTMILASNGNPFIVFYLSRGGTGSAMYHRIIAYYNGSEWHLNPTGDPSTWSTSVTPKKLVNVDNRVYLTGFGSGIFEGDVAYFDTTTETLTEGWQISYQMMIPNDSDLWNLTSFIDDIDIVVSGTINGTFLGGEYVVLHLDVYNGSQWFTDIASHTSTQWKIYMAGTGSPETKTYTLSMASTTSQYKLRNYLQTDEEIRNSRVRFWFTSPSRVATCVIDKVYYELMNSFGYVIETVPVENYTDSHGTCRTWQTLNVDGYTGAQTDWTKVGSTPYLDGYNDASYITTTTAKANDSGYTFENLAVSGGTVRGAYLYVQCSFEIAVNNYVDVYIYDGSTWQFAHQYAIGDPRSWYVNVTGILNTFDKVNSAQLRFTHHDVSASYTINYAELIIDYDKAEYPDSWNTHGDAPYLDAADSNNVNITQGPVSIFLYDESTTINMPVPNLISYFTMAQPTHLVNTTNPIYVFWYDPIDVAFQESPNGYLSAFLVSETGQTLIADEASMTNMKLRHNNLGDWEDTGEWWNYTLWNMNLATSINNVFDAKAIGHKAGFSSELMFWNGTLGDYQTEWVNQTDGLYWGTTLASSVALDGTPLAFHYYNESIFATLYNGFAWHVRKILEENSTILNLNYGEDRCFSYVVHSASYDVMFYMPFLRVQIRAVTTDGVPLEDIGVYINGELLLTPYDNYYDLVGEYLIRVYPNATSLVIEGIPYIFMYYTVEASPETIYNIAYITLDLTGDAIITLVYQATGLPPYRPPEPKPTVTVMCENWYLFLLALVILILIWAVGEYYKRQWVLVIPATPILAWALWVVLNNIPCNSHWRWMIPICIIAIIYSIYRYKTRS